MAIKNASDLLVYAKTTAPAKQKTRIRVLTTDPIEVPDGGTTGTLKIIILLMIVGLFLMIYLQQQLVIQVQVC